MEQMMNLLNEPLVQIVVMIVLFFVALWILKSIIKAFIFIFFFYIFFNILFLWTPQEFKDNFFFAKMLKQESAEKLYNNYEAFYEKRQELSPIDEERLKDDLKTKEEEVKDFIENKVDEIKASIPNPLPEQQQQEEEVTNKTSIDVLKNLINN